MGEPLGPRSSLWQSATGLQRSATLGLLLLASTALAVGLTQPVVYLRRGLSRHTYSVLAGIFDLAEGGNVLLALIVFAFSVVFPIAKLAGLFALLLVRFSEERRAKVLRSLAVLGRWSMLDVFVVAILVGSVELGILSKSRPRIGLYVFAAAVLLSMVATMALERLTMRDLEGSALNALRERGRPGRWLSAVACLLFLVGLSLPLMIVEKWYFWDHQYSVLGSAWSLVEGGHGLLGYAVLVFVVALPLARFAALAWFQWARSSARAARAVLLIDKWAMLDVFGLALLIVIVKIGDIAYVDTRPGFWILLVAVSLSLYDSWTLQRRAGKRPPT